MAKARKVGWYLREWRKKRGYNQEKFAELVGTSAGYISDLERGERRFNQDTLEAFATALNIRPGDLINVNPLKEENPIYSIWETVKPVDRPRVLRLLEDFAKTGTDDS